MPKYVSCPVCESDVKVPRDAEAGDALTCPGCDEVFTPPHLVKKAHDPEMEESFAVARPRKREVERSEEHREKRRKTQAFQKAGRQYERDINRSTSTPLFGGPELV